MPQTPSRGPGAGALVRSYEALEQEGARLRVLRDRLEEQVLAAMPETRVNGAGAARMPNTSSLSFRGVDGESVVLGLDLRGICASTGSACSTGEPEPSHVLRAMGLSARQAQGTVRLSLGHATSEEDIDATVTAIVETVRHLRRITSDRDDAA